MKSKIETVSPTAGPYLVEDLDLSSKIRAPDGLMIAEVHQYRGGPIGAEERKAIARLFGAAPELYEIAKTIVAHLDRDHHPKLYDAALAAIGKVGG